MVRLFLGAGLLYIAIRIVWRFSEILEKTIEPMSFAIGIGVALVVAFALFQIDGWWSAVTRPGRAQQVSMQTTETPRQITSASCWTAVTGIGLALVIGAIVVKLLFP
jgi:hypothetical protein